MTIDLEALERVGAALERTQLESVFVGGSTLPFFVRTHRPTEDIDCIVDFGVDRIRTRSLLLQAGFREDASSRVIVRWKLLDLTVDIVPRTDHYFGFSGRWDDLAFHTRRPVSLPSGRTLHVLSPAVFFLTKVEAFEDRGRTDPWASKDAEDLAALLVECDALEADVAKLPIAGRERVATWAASVLADRDTLLALRANLPQQSRGLNFERALNATLERLVSAS